jgi:hypothetical protein
MAICPWSTREGLLLTQLDTYATDPALQVNPLDVGDQEGLAELRDLGKSVD